MLFWLFFILMFGILMLLFAVSVLLRFFRSLFNVKRKSKQKTEPVQNKKNKVFDKNDGEYVDYEEVKDDSSVAN